MREKGGNIRLSLYTGSRFGEKCPGTPEEGVSGHSLLYMRMRARVRESSFPVTAILAGILHPVHDYQAEVSFGAIMAESTRLAASTDGISAMVMRRLPLSSVRTQRRKLRMA